MILIWICAYLGLVLLPSICVAQQRYNLRHPLTDMPPPAEGIITTYYFPEYPDMKFPIGETVTALCLFANEGDVTYNISAIMGSLNSPIYFRHHYQNYSYKPIGMLLGAGEEVSLEYNFQLHPDLDPVDYQLSINVFYDSETETFRSTFFNKSVELYYSSSDHDFEIITAVLTAFIFTFLTIALTYVLCVPDSKISSVLFSQAKSMIGNDGKGQTNSEDDDETWEAMQKKMLKKKKNK